MAEDGWEVIAEGPKVFFINRRKNSVSNLLTFDTALLITLLRVSYGAKQRQCPDGTATNTIAITRKTTGT
jgi:hypothetical protein